MSIRLQQSTTAYKIPFLLILSSDHISPAAGKSPTVTISKNGAAFASPSGAVSEVSGGWYVIAGNATDSNTLGPLMVHVTEASSDNTDCLFEVVVQDLTTATIAAVTTVTNLTNAPTAGDLTATMKTSVTTACTASTPTATVSGDLSATMKTSVTTACTASTPTAAAVTGAVGSVTGNVGGNVVGSVGSVTGAVGSVTAGVTVTTNNDKTGYSITGTPSVNVAQINGTVVNGNGGVTPWGP